MRYTKEMALSPSEQVLEALRAALDQVPLTAEQRQKTLSEFALRIGQPMVSAPMAMPAMALSGAPIDSKRALQQALNQALESAHTPAAPIAHEDRNTLQQDLIARLQVQMESAGDGIDHAAVKGLVRDSLVRERSRGRLSFSLGFFYSLIEAVLLSVVLTAIVVISAGTALFAMPLFLTIADIFIVLVGAQLLGSLHERIWFSHPFLLNIATLIRGLLTPITVPLGLLLLAHERLWGDYSQNKLARIGRSLITPITVPVGAVWNATGFVLKKIQQAVPQKKQVSNGTLALKEEKKSKNNVSVIPTALKTA